MSRAWVLDFVRPDDWITANDRSHWAAKAALTATWRHAAKTYAQQARIPRLERAHILVQPCFTSGRIRDVGNWSPTAKACVDGIVTDAKVLANDDDAHLIGPDMRQGPRITTGLARIRITITELDPNERNAA